MIAMKTGLTIAATIAALASAAMTMPVSAQPAPAQTSAVTERLGIPGPITFDGKTYALAWSSQPMPTYIKQEYVPAGQSVKTYTEMMLIEAVTQPMKPLDAASAQVQMLQKRKSTDPVVNYEIIQNKQSGEVLLDFLISDTKADPIVVEWNAYRYVPLRGQDGVALYAISRRAYGHDDAKALLAGLKTSRKPAVSALAKFDLPAITIRK